MDHTYWHKQTTEKPLFPDLVWSQPENKQHAGKLLIVGGNSFGFATVGEAYMKASEAGAGTVRVVLPEAIRKIVGGFLPDAEFAASNPSGGFAQAALDTLLAQSQWADAVLLAGDIGHNSETAILIEKFLSKYKGQVVLTGDALDVALSTPDVVYARAGTLAVASMGQLQKLGQAARFTTAFRLGMDLIQLVDALHEFTAQYPVYILTKHHEHLVVAADGQVSTTAMISDSDMWRVGTAAAASVWWLQSPDKAFQALSTACISASS